MSGDARTELASIAAALRAYLDFQQDAGTYGFPRRTAGSLSSVAMPTVTAQATAAPATGAAPPPSAPPPVPPAPAASPEPAAAGEPGLTTTTETNPEARLVLLARTVASCTKCGLASTRTQTVFSRGNPKARLCFVGEAPGADEDAQGLPFVGRAGQLLDRMIGAMGLSPENDVYICNILKCRPPGNRRPEPEESATCIPYLHEQLEIVRPHVLVALGNTAVAALLDTRLGITKLRGQWKLYRGTTLLMPTYHPSYLLRPSPQQTEAKRQAWEDLQLVMKELGLELPKRPTAGPQADATKQKS
jgi:DNA polymerase